MQVSVIGGLPTFPPKVKSTYITAGAATCTVITEQDIFAPDANIASVTNNAIIPITNTKFYPTVDAFGINTGTASTLPNYSSYPLDKYKFGLVRSHDNYNLSWKDVNPVNGTFYWTDLDNWVKYNYTAKRDLIYTVYQTPTWASANPSELGPYSSLGWNREPANMVYLANFITAVVDRYKKAGTPIKYWEVSNEPNFKHASNNSYFFAGTKTKLAEMTRIISQSVKAVDPTAKIISPAMTNIDETSSGQSAGDLPSAYFPAMLSASDNEAGTMAQWIDIIGIHLYGDAKLYPNRVNNIKAMMATAGVENLPIIDTETGYTLNGVSDYIVVRDIIRSYVTPLAMGVKAVCLYQMGTYTSTTYSLLSRPTALERISILLQEMMDYGIDSVGFTSEGEVTYTCNGNNYRF